MIINELNKNMKSIYSIILFVFITSNLAAQNQQLDSLFTIDGVYLVNVTEISNEEIKYKFPNEDLINGINKNKVCCPLLTR